MTIRCVVLPRGINIGGHNRVPMADLRSKLADIGYDDPITLGQSGNIIVSADSPCDSPKSSSAARGVAADVGRLLADEYGVDVPCLGRTAAEIQAIHRHDPLGSIAEDGSRYLVIFLSEAPRPELIRELLQTDHAPEVLHIEGSEAFVWAPEGIRELRLTYAHLERHLGVTATARNWNTLERIASKL